MDRNRRAVEPEDNLLTEGPVCFYVRLRQGTEDAGCRMAAISKSPGVEAHRKKDPFETPDALADSALTHMGALNK